MHQLVGGGRSIWAIGMTPDGKSIAWGTINRGGTETNLTPLERAFHLEERRFPHALEAIPSGPVRSRQPNPGDGQGLQSGRQREWANRPHIPEERAGVGLLFQLVARRPGSCGNQLWSISGPCGRQQNLGKYTGHSGGVTAISTAANGRRFVTGSNDQNVRIWDPERQTALLSLFFADPDWIAWTEEGVYAASANGERLMGWQVNRGIDTLASYYSAAQFRRSLYHPDVIRHMALAGSLAKAFALAGKKPQMRRASARCCRRP